MTPHLVDRSGQTYQMNGLRWRGDDGGPLALSALPGLTPEQIVLSDHSIWRYQAVIPVDPKFRVSLGEGTTPLVTLPWEGTSIKFKLEWFNPTSSFKDRGASTMISYLKSQGAVRVLEDSSGNGGAAVAAYSAAAGLSAKIIVPMGTSPSKIMQAKAFGAQIEMVHGTRDQVGEEAVRQSKTIPYASHNWHPLFLHGIKTIGYEIWESLDFRAPDNIIMVAGAGSQVLGCDLAFQELFTAGQIQKLPRLFIGQPADWATIADKINGRVGHSAQNPTIALGASIANPVRLPEVVAAIRHSKGGAVAVNDDEIRTAVLELAAIGLYVEPTSAVATAALKHLLNRGDVGDSETTVVILSGTGLKASEQMFEIIS